MYKYDDKFLSNARAENMSKTRSELQKKLWLQKLLKIELLFGAWAAAVFLGEWLTYGLRTDHLHFEV